LHIRRRSTSASFPNQHRNTSGRNGGVPCKIRDAAALTRQSVCWRPKKLANLITASFISLWPSHGSRSPISMRRGSIRSRAGTRPGAADPGKATALGLGDDSARRHLGGALAPRISAAWSNSASACRGGAVSRDELFSKAINIEQSTAPNRVSARCCRANCCYDTNPGPTPRFGLGFFFRRAASIQFFRLKQSLSGPTGEALVVLCDLDHHALGYRLDHSLGMQASFFGPVAPMLRIGHKVGGHLNHASCGRLCGKSHGHKPGLAEGARGSLREGVRTLAANPNCRKPNWFPCAGKKKAQSDDGAKSR
jgi:hypothetical protein